DALRPYFPSPSSFQNCLRHCEAVVSGAFALAFLLQGGSEPVVWTPGELEIYCTVAHAARMLHFLTHDCNYTLLRSPAPNSSNATNDIDLAFRLTCSTSSLVVDIFCTDSPSPLAPLTRFWGTHLINYISASTISIAYPGATLRFVGALN
ncbi:hypothetical protein FA95DRAFT_1450745, partial [Auriscalpium vulgare]